MRLRLDGVHIRVRESEMVADFVYQDVLNEMIEPLITALDPFRQNREPVEKNPIGKGLRPADRFLSEINALIETGQLIGILDPEMVQHLLLREVGDENGDVLGVLPENVRQIVIGALRHDLEICGRDGTRVGDLMRVHETKIGRPISASNPCGPSR